MPSFVKQRWIEAELLQKPQFEAPDYRGSVKLQGLSAPITSGDSGRRRATASTRSKQMAAYGKKAAEKVERAVHEKKKGTLRSGKSGKKVTSRKQAIAIGLSEARRAGGKVPRKRAS